MNFGILLSLCLAFTSPVWAEAEETSTTAPATVSTPEAAPVATAEETQVKEKTEDQIPVNLTKTKKAETAESSTGRLFLTFGMMAVVLGLAYYFAKKYGRPKSSPQTKIKILTQHFLGPKKSLAIVRVAGESILIGITDQNINMIKSLSLLDDEVPDSVSSASFQETFNEKKEMTTSKPVAGTNAGEEFSIRHIKDVVSLKLKGMRNDL